MPQVALTFPQLTAFVAAVFTPNKSGNAVYTPSFDNTLKMLDKIGKEITLPQRYIDKLEELNGEFLPDGKIIEEYCRDLILPTDVSADDPATTLADYTPSARQPYYSYSTDEKVIEITRKFNDLQRAFTSVEGTAKAVESLMKSMQDSTLVYRYQIKRQMLGNFIHLCEESQTGAVVFSAASAYLKGAYVKNAAAATKYGTIFNVYAANDATDWADAVSKGYIVELSLIDTVADPTLDEANGSAFLKKIRETVEKSNDNSQGHSLSGNTLGAQDSIRMYVKQGIMPALDVQTMAGAFHLDKVAVPVEITVLPDFGDADDSIICLIEDFRGTRLHPSCDYVLDQTVGRKGWVSYFRHLQYTAFISRNTFVKVYKVG